MARQEKYRVKKRCVSDWLRANRIALVMISSMLLITYMAVTYDYTEVKSEELEPEIVYRTVTEYVEVDTGLSPHYQSIADNMTEEEYHLLADIICLEAGNQSHTGQRAVVEVVFNRVLDERFPDTVKEVLSQQGQFSTWKYRERAKPTQEQYNAIDATLRTVEPILLKEVVFFASVDMPYDLYERIGGHNFYYG